MDRLEFDDRLQTLLLRWEEVERSMKRAELLRGEIVLPAVNELRYAGRYIISAINQSGKLGYSSLYSEAIIHSEQCLNNAEKEIIDSIVFYISSRVKELNFRFGRQKVIDQYASYVDLLQALRTCEESILSSNGHAANKKFLYDEMKDNDLINLLQEYDKLVDADFLMELQIQREKNKTLHFKYWSYVATSISAALVFVVAAFAARLFI